MGARNTMPQTKYARSLPKPLTADEIGDQQMPTISEALGIKIVWRSWF